jgi:GT2 family glycosyltransferase/glycosyltransferase involved in cell wall biosynthesis
MSAGESLRRTKRRHEDQLAMRVDRIRFLEEQGRKADEEIQGLQVRIRDYENAISEIENWQKSWFRRAFQRWHFRRSQNHPGFCHRLISSIRKRVLGVPPPCPEQDHLKSRAEEEVNPIGADFQDPDDEFELLKRTIRKRRNMELGEFLASGSRISFIQHGTPEVSVLIVLFNQAAFTLDCLRALQAITDVGLEVIIVDNASTDDTRRLLQCVHGAKILLNETNTGFVRAVNQAAREARGECLLLLNSDAVPRPGSMRWAWETLESSSDIGAVGARLILPNDTVQEAGSIIWNDGNCNGYGRGLPEEYFECMFRRDVDYCSAAFLLIRRSLFEQLGGFDENFSPAYYEETDFCMRLRANGYRVVYDPRVAVDHFEFASSLNQSATRALQARNSGLFRSKHETVLKKHFVQGPGVHFHARSRRATRGNILFLDDLVPLATRGSGCPRALSLLMSMHRAGYFVTFWPLRQAEETLEASYQILPLEMELVIGLADTALPEFLTERAGFYHTIFVSRPQNMEKIVKIQKVSPELFEGVGIIYDAEAIFSVRETKKAELSGSPLSAEEAESLLNEELQLAKSAAAISVTSKADENIYRSAGFENIYVLGGAIPPTPRMNPFSARQGILFVGRLLENDSPNTDSLLWFLMKVLPEIRRHLGEKVPVNILGASTSSVLHTFQDGTFKLRGPVDDLSPWFGQSRIFIAPTRFAAGISIKVVEAAANGLPVVATNILADQLGWKNGIDLLSSDDPLTFANHCVRLYSDEDLWNTIRESALNKIRTDFSEELQSRLLEEMLGLVYKNPRSDVFAL